MADRPAIVWYRSDLRLADNPALRDAIDGGGSVVPVFIWDPAAAGDWSPGAASRWWLHHSLARLDESLRERGSRLIYRQGPALSALRGLCEQTRASGVAFNRRYAPALAASDEAVQQELQAVGLKTTTFNGSLLRDPDDVTTQQGGPYQVFTPYWKRCSTREPIGESLPRPRKIRAPSEWPDSVSLDDFQLLPRRDWADAFPARWTPGEEGAQAALKEFLAGPIERYAEGRDRPDQLGTSSLSPHLHFGEISPRQVWERVVGKFGPPRSTVGGARSGPEVFLTEIGWREFAHHVLHHFPETPDQPLRENFAEFPWASSSRQLRAWQRGETGYPIVDAGMRELWTTGWMHNRVRMIVGSFLTKHLRHHWRQGARWFWDTLVDADLANNTLGWQWVAGCGADAAPYFRVFNPVRQGEKFDPEGRYVRRWVPELAALPDDLIHQPWEASATELAAAGVRLGESYPAPIVDHKTARAAALDAWEQIK